ncbi:phospholipase D-like domain-containing protein [Defluviimonas sp. WL0024]|uniref:Phospholipase D n=1 Tax=Albidovulum salinarum TaxID=2984153 RepID=A0ABT2X8G2_9RHOB|nr:phospholipase D-like domain-containing protein [Defluviimonas sp. WL0024]MCU9850241.1 phospholipase D-like domain-containing protein [Defluviimonas sp. WL0024]
MLKSFEYSTVQSAFRTLLTAEEAFPALEREFLHARSEIWASFRIFDAMTALRSPEARAVGRTWFDLIVATLRRGVAITIVITDFDPIARVSLHRKTWRSVRQFIAAAELAGPEARLKVIPAMHAARTGLLPRLLFWPVIVWKQARAAGWLNRRSDAEQRDALRELPGTRERLVRRADGRFRPRFWPIPMLCPATHHQKLAVFDRKRLYIGGLDLDERRFDTPEHDREGEETWHDVQILTDGPAAREAQEHLETFVGITSGNGQPAKTRMLLRTISRPRPNNLLYFGPEPVVEEIATAHEHHARRARRLIYIETQYFRDLKLARYLANLARSKPDLCMILILPAAPEEIAFDKRVGLDARFGEFLQSRALRIVSKAFRSRLFVGGAAQPRRSDGQNGNGTGRDRLFDAPLVYIHAKVSIFDDVAAIVSSANLNGRSLHWDTEAGLLITQRRRVEDLRRKIMQHWLPKNAGEAFFDPVRAVSEWRALAIGNARKDPENRHGFLLPYDLKAAEKFAANVPIVPDEMV